VDHFSKELGGLIDWQRNGQVLKENGYSTTLVSDEAVRIIQGDDGSKPLFLFAAFLAPHAPYQAPPDYVDRYKAIADEKRRTYAAMVTALDDQVGRVVAALDKKGMRDNTVIVFTSTNGGAKAPASNGNFRDGKGSLHEGGVRVPTIINWPGKLKPGVSNEPLHMVDLMPTLLALAGARGSSDRPFDGKDMHELEARLGRYARDMEPSKWFKAQPALVDAQGRTVFEPGFVIDDAGVPGEKPTLPGVGSRALR